MGGRSSGEVNYQGASLRPTLRPADSAGVLVARFELVKSGIQAKDAKPIYFQLDKAQSNFSGLRNISWIQSKKSSRSSPQKVNGRVSKSSTIS